jgi:hypothetical protein
LREEDKEERREGSHFGLEISAKGKGVGGEKWGKEGILETLIGHRCCWGGQETARIPGAREPERLFLVGWEVNIQLGSLGKLKNKRTRD